MGNKWMNNCLTMYIEIDVARKIDNEDIIQQFQNTKYHKGNCKTFCIKDFFFFGDVNIFNLSFV